MMKFETGKYYVYGAGWEGMDYEDLEICKPDGIYDNLEDAIKEVNRLWEEELECDESSYIYHNGILREVSSTGKTVY